MTVWLDAHLSPRIANWLAETFVVGAVSVRDVGLRKILAVNFQEALRVKPSWERLRESG